MISKEEVKHIAKLARLSLPEKEEDKMGEELSAILNYIEKLKEVDIRGAEPTSHSVLIKNVLRKDQDSEKDPELIRRLVDEFPERQNNYLKVKSIF